MKKRLCLIFLIPLLISFSTTAQTAASLFRISDSLQVAEVVSDKADMKSEVGHMGPAVENSHMAMRLIFDDSGAIDVYSKSGRGMELELYKWYPSARMRESAGVGADVYETGNTLGLGGVALWDGEKVVRLAATKGRTARIGDTKKGAYAEIVAYGVEYKGDLVDVAVRVEMTAKSRIANITARTLGGEKVVFVTGVNFHEGQKLIEGEGYVAVWGKHPSEGSQINVGAGMFYSVKDFPTLKKTEDMILLISEASDKIDTKVLSSSSMEAELNTAKRFEAYMAK